MCYLINTDSCINATCIELLIRCTVKSNFTLITKILIMTFKFYFRSFTSMDSRRPKQSTVTVSRQNSAPSRPHVTLSSKRHDGNHHHVRRYSVDTSDVRTHHDRHPSLQRTISYTTLADLKQISWSEYTARRSLVKFRNRRMASQRSRDQIGDVPPSQMAVRVLCSQYEVCRSSEKRIPERIMAVFYCWFFGWITDVYGSLTHGGTERSFVKWLLSCILVTMAVTGCIVLAATTAHCTVVLFASLLHSFSAFVAFITVIFVLGLGIITIFSYG
jgi:hypothetical protein